MIEKTIVYAMMVWLICGTVLGGISMLTESKCECPEYVPNEINITNHIVQNDTYIFINNDTITKETTQWEEK